MRTLHITALFFLLALSVTGKGFYTYTLQGRMYDRNTGAPLRNELFLFNGDSVYSDSTGAYTCTVSWTTNACMIPFYKRSAFLNKTNAKKNCGGTRSSKTVHAQQVEEVGPARVW